MAQFGLKHLVVAPVYTEGTNTITYSAGAVCEHARRAAITYNWDEAKLYGDDGLAEYLKTLTDADVELETTELTPTIAVMMGLEKVKTAATGTSPAVYTMVADVSQAVGVGYIGVDFINGSKIYTGVWIHKVVFSRNNEERNTKEETVNWGTPTVSGKAHPVYLDATGEAQIRDYSEFETETDAIAWVNGKAGISNPTGQG